MGHGGSVASVTAARTGSESAAAAAVISLATPSSAHALSRVESGARKSCRCASSSTHQHHETTSGPPAGGFAYLPAKLQALRKPVGVSSASLAGRRSGSLGAAARRGVVAVALLRRHWREAFTAAVWDAQPASETRLPDFPDLLSSSLARFWCALGMAAVPGGGVGKPSELRWKVWA
ncbi:MAG: hypothetical protein WDW38_001671 [Sanguina aurantia]